MRSYLATRQGTYGEVSSAGPERPECSQKEIHASTQAMEDTDDPKESKPSGPCNFKGEGREGIM